MTQTVNIHCRLLLVNSEQHAALFTVNNQWHSNMYHMSAGEVRSQ